MRNVLYLTKLELLKYIRQPITVGFGIVFPIVWIVMNGFMFTNNPSNILGGFGTVDFMFPAYIFMIVLVSGLSSLPLVLAKNYEMKAIVRYSFTPIKRYQYLTALFSGNSIAVMLSSIVMFFIGIIIYNITVPPAMNLFLMILAVIVICVAVSSFGIFLASTLGGFQSTLSVSLLVYFLLLFLTGATVPLPVLPEIFITISGYIPFSHMVSLLQNIWLCNTDGLMLHLTITVATALALFLLALFTFKWSNKK